MERGNVRSQLLAMQTELRRMAYRLTADNEVAQDLLQETSLRVLVSEDKFRTNTNFKGWVYTIMRHLFINECRRTAREQNRTDDEVRTLPAEYREGVCSAEGVFEAKEINRAINAQPDDLRVPFALLISGFKYQEIADKLNLPLGTVKSRIFSIRQNLQRQLRDYVL